MCGILLFTLAFATDGPNPAGEFTSPAKVEFLVGELEVAEAIIDQLEARLESTKKEMESTTGKERQGRQKLIEFLEKELDPWRKNADESQAKIIEWVRGNVHRIKKERQEALYQREQLPAVQTRIDEEEKEIQLLEEEYGHAVANGEPERVLTPIRERIRLKKNELSRLMKKYRQSLEQDSRGEAKD